MNPIVKYIPGMSFEDLQNWIFMATQIVGTDSLQELNMNTVIELHYVDKEEFTEFMNNHIVALHDNVIDYNGKTFDMANGRKLLCKYVGEVRITEGQIKEAMKSMTNAPMHWEPEHKGTEPKPVVLYGISLLPEGLDFETLLRIYNQEGILLYDESKGKPEVFMFDLVDSEVITVGDIV